MKRRTLTATLMIPVLLALTITPSISAQTQAEALSNDQAGYGFTTGVVGIVQGQTARLTVWNKGDKAVAARLQFLDSEGKVLIFCNEIIMPGKSDVEVFSPDTGPANRIEFQAQYGTAEKSSIGLLVPTLQITDGTSNATSWMIGPEGFVEFRSITFGGSLVWGALVHGSPLQPQR